MNNNVMNRIRLWLIQRIAGPRMVMVNLVHTSGVRVPGNASLLMANCRYEGDGTGTAITVEGNE